MSRKKIGSLAGSGSVWSGDKQIATVGYEITEWQEFTSIQPLGGSTSQEIPGAIVRSGFIDELSSSPSGLLAVRMLRLTLELNDGRYLDFDLSSNLNNAMTKWKIACSGDIRTER